MLDLSPEVETLVRENAQSAGVTESEYIARLVSDAVQTPKPKELGVPALSLQARLKKSDDEKRAKVLELLSLSKEEAIARNAPSIAFLSAQLAEAENATPEEVAEANAEWEAYKKSMNDNRRLTGERLLYLEETNL